MFIGIKLLAVAETMVRWVKIMKGEMAYSIYSDGLKLRMPPCFSRFLTVPLRMPFFWPHLECLHR